MQLFHGENGLLSKSQLAKERTTEGEQDERNKLSSYENEINNYGTWERANEIERPTVLYENSNGVANAGNFELQEDIDQYNRFIVYYYASGANGKNVYKSVEVYNKGITVLLDAFIYHTLYNNKNVIRNYSTELTLPQTGKIVNLSAGWTAQTIAGSSPSIDSSNSGNLAICKILGYK